MRTYLNFQLTLMLIIIAAIAVDIFIISPEQQQGQLDELSRELAAQITLFQPKDKPSMAFFLQQNKSYANPESGKIFVKIKLNESNWLFTSNSAINSSPDFWLESRHVIYHANLSERDSLGKIIGEINISTPIDYRLNHAFLVIVSILTVLTSIGLTLKLSKKQRVKKSKNDNLNSPSVSLSTMEANSSNPPEKESLEPDLAKEELELAKKSAVEASRIKSQIIANTSHELLTPLNSIVGFSDSLLNHSFSKKQHREFLSQINDNAQHLLGLVNDLLDFSANSKKHYRINYQTINIYQLLSSISRTFAGEAQAKSLELLTDFDSLYNVHIDTDQLRLRQVISNLLINAIRNTANGHIAINACIETTHKSDIKANEIKTVDTVNSHVLHISIQDTGVGISEQNQQKIFSSMISMRTTGAEGEKLKNNPGLGLGLGLAIVTSIIQRMNASLTVDSSLGKGTTFNIKFPIKNFTPTPAAFIEHEKKNTILLLDNYKPSAINLSGRLSHHSYIVTLENNIDNFIAKQTNHQFAVIKPNPDINLNEVEGPWYKLLLNIKIPTVLLVPTGTRFASSKLSMYIKKLRFFELPYAIDDFPTQAIFNSGKSADHQAISSPSVIQERLKVLIADDNPSNLALLAHLLTELECDVETVNNGLEAKRVVKLKRFDCMFIDIRMQPINGLDIIRYIRTELKDPDALVFACTAHTSAEEYRNLLDSGFNNVIHKPLTLVKIQTLLSKHGKIVSVKRSEIDLSEKNTITPTFSLRSALQKTAGHKDLAKQRLTNLNAALVEMAQKKSEIKRMDKESLITHIHNLNGLAAMSGGLIIHQQLCQLETQLKEIRRDASPAKIMDAGFANIAVFTNWYNEIDVDILFD